MDFGRMRHPLTIRNFTATQDPMTGEILEEWADMATVWASIDTISGREFVAAGAEQAETTHRITMYYRDDLTTVMRLKSGATEYEIKAILPNNDRSLMTVMCEVLS